MTGGAKNSLHKLHKTSEIAVLKTQDLLDSVKNKALLPHLTENELKMAVKILCFQLAQMHNLPAYCLKRRTQNLNPSELQMIHEIEQGFLQVTALSQEFFVLLKKERTDWDLILKSMKGCSKNLHFFYQISSSFH